MIFLNEHARSIPAKILMALGVLTGIITAILLVSDYSEWLMNATGPVSSEGDRLRILIMLICCLIYFFRFTFSLFVFVQRKIAWLEAIVVSILFYMMFYYFCFSAGSYGGSVGVLDFIGVALFLSGSAINVVADYQKFAWKKESKNRGKLYTSGLFRYSMHINYFGDALGYFGLALITHNAVCVSISLGMMVYFIGFEIPLLDRHLKQKYTKEFEAYARRTKKFVPFIY